MRDWTLSERTLHFSQKTENINSIDLYQGEGRIVGAGNGHWVEFSRKKHHEIEKCLERDLGRKGVAYSLSLRPHIQPSSRSPHPPFLSFHPTQDHRYLTWFTQQPPIQSPWFYLVCRKHSSRSDQTYLVPKPTMAAHICQVFTQMSPLQRGLPSLTLHPTPTSALLIAFPNVLLFFMAHHFLTFIQVLPYHVYWYLSVSSH